MKHRAVVGSVLLLLALTGCKSLMKQDTVEDDFSDGKTDSYWNVFSNGCSVVESDGELRIHGTTEVEGWGNGSGLMTVDSFTEGDFDVSVDFSVPEFSGSGTRLIYLMAKEPTPDVVGIFYSYGFGYRVQTWNPRQFSDWLKPFGDEDSTYHRMRLTYDAESETLTGYVDDLLVGSLNIPMSGDIPFAIQAASKTAGMEIDVRFDNFKVTR